jgi:mannose-6-phosphate isomerase
MARATDPIAVPLLLASSYDAKTWGGRRLESLGKSLPPGKIGESLESGPDAVIAGGPFDGVTLGDLSRTHARALLGRRGVAAAGSLNDFPLLVKLIDANEDLSVQVHPDDASAPAGKRGKTEAWYILDAQPGARIVSGVRGPIQIDRIREQMVETIVQPGEVYFVPAGTVHAIGAGVLLYEIQQASDVTWRLFDWGRPREIHVDAALVAARPEQFAARVAPLRVTDDRDMLVACRHFALERFRVDGRVYLPSFAEAFRVMTVLDGAVTIAGVLVRRGATAVLPADLPEQELEGQGSFLLGYIPDLERDVRRPLLDAGHDLNSIRRIGADL